MSITQTAAGTALDADTEQAAARHRTPDPQDSSRARRAHTDRQAQLDAWRDQGRQQ